MQQHNEALGRKTLLNNLHKKMLKSSMTEERLVSASAQKPLSVSRSQIHLGTPPDIYHTQSTPYLAQGNLTNLSGKNEIDLDLGLLSRYHKKGLQPRLHPRSRSQLAAGTNPGAGPPQEVRRQRQ